MTYMQCAFEAIVDKIRRKPESWYVVLLELSPFYGGPEEGGWWGTDQHLVEFAEFPSRQLADEARARIHFLAEDLQHQARREHGEQCLREMSWLEARGLDADFLPEPDGPSTFRVIVTNELPPTHVRGNRRYE